VLKCKEKTFYKVHIKILFHSSNVNTDSALSSNRVKLEEEEEEEEEEKKERERLLVHVLLLIQHTKFHTNIKQLVLLEPFILKFLSL
jgi:hypothetical protein